MGRLGERLRPKAPWLIALALLVAGGGLLGASAAEIDRAAAGGGVAAHPLRPEPGLSLEVSEVSHRFDLHGEALPVLDRVGFRIEPGEFVALLGPSGCGKSTLLRLVAGLEPPSAGRLLADGAAVTGPDPSRLMVFQDPTLFPWRNGRRWPGRWSTIPAC